jgi:hypothetical protein
VSAQAKDTRATRSWKVWEFVRGDLELSDFLEWVYSDADSKRAFGETLHFDLISGDQRDRHAAYRLREALFEWGLNLRPSECSFFDYLQQHPIAFNDMAALDLGRGSMRLLLTIGYWHSADTPHLPHPRDYVDLEWDPNERKRVEDYLAGAYVYTGGCGFSWCRMGCHWTQMHMGWRDLTDGTWLFPEGFAHYIVHHAVKPELPFLEHVRRNEYQVPALPLLPLRGRLHHRRST